MTQEEKAKAYDEALKDMRVIYPNLKGDAKLAVEHAFPQLRESEDERIRKTLIHIVKGACDKYGIKYKGDEITEEKLLAYLEKQKDIEDRWIEDRGQCFWNGVEEGKMLYEKQKEQKPVGNKKEEMTEFEQSVYDLCPVLGIEEAKATASDLLELAKKTLLKTGKVVLASNYPEGCSFEDGFHLGYSEGFNAKKDA